MQDRYRSVTTEGEPTYARWGDSEIRQNLCLPNLLSLRSTSMIATGCAHISHPYYTYSPSTYSSKTEHDPRSQSLPVISQKFAQVTLDNSSKSAPACTSLKAHDVSIRSIPVVSTYFSY